MTATMLLPVLAGLIPAMLLGGAAALLGVWLLARGHRGPGAALIGWAALRALNASAGGLFMVIQLQAYTSGTGGFGPDLVDVAWALGDGVASVVSVALLVYAALGDRLTPSEPRS